MNKLAKVQLFSKKYCGICQDVQYKIQKLQQSLKFDFETVDIELPSNKEFLKRYIYDIPVIHLNGQEIMRHGIDEDAFKKAILHESR